jgi:hypothetical protein
MAVQQNSTQVWIKAVAGAKTILAARTYQLSKGSNFKAVLTGG